MSYRTLIRTIAGYHKLDPLLVEAVVTVESAGMFNAYRYEPAFWQRYLVNHPRYKDMPPREASASYGLMQIMYSTAVEEGFTGMPWELFNPILSLEYGCRHLSKNLAWADNYEAGTLTDREIASALAAYNGGRRGNEPDANPDRNGAYAAKVLKVRALLASDAALRKA